MKKSFFVLFFSALGLCALHAQSKIFKEVSEDISSQVKIIRQDNSLVGYLAFTQLEKASEDSFNYRVTIMDENLNEIGKMNFRDEYLDLQGVAFESDVLCLGFLRSNAIGKPAKSQKTYKALTANVHNSVVTRFVSLRGEILQTNVIAAEIETSRSYNYNRVTGQLRERLQLVNITQKGFSIFYGDDENNYLVAYNTKGKELWKKTVDNRTDKGYYLLGSADGAYLLSKKNGAKAEGGFEITGFSHENKTGFDKLLLKDKQGNSLKVLSFDNDPQTGKPFVTGMIINPEKDGIITMKDATKMPYIGVFSFQLKGPKKEDLVQTYSYWNRNQTGLVDEKGRFVKSNDYAYFHQGFMDQQGNTYFAGSSIRRRTQWGTVAVATILSPLIVASPMLIAMIGTQKCKVTDATLLKLSPDGTLSYASSIPCNHTSYKAGKALFSMFGPQKQFYKVSNGDTKTDYLIVDDVKDIVIYNVTQGKVARTISHKDGKVRTNVFPAKEGHVMVTEYNQKEKSTRVSIESL
jgi:hypothetical protein